MLWATLKLLLDALALAYLLLKTPSSELHGRSLRSLLGHPAPEMRWMTIAVTTQLLVQWVATPNLPSIVGAA